MNTVHAPTARPPGKRPPGALLLAHYWMPVASGWSAAVVVQQSNGMAFSPSGLTFLLASIGCAYSWDRVWDRPDGEPRWIGVALWLGVLLSGALGFLAVTHLPVAAFEMAGLLAVITVAYPWLKRLPLLKNLLVSLVWVMAATFFPFLPAHGALGWWFESWLSWNATIPLFILWVAACLLCDLKDEEEDRASGVKSLPVLFGTRGASAIAALLSAAAALVALYAGRPGLVVAALVMITLTRFPALLRRKAAGPLVVDATLALPGVLFLLWR